MTESNEAVASRGARAKEILGNDLVKGALQAMRDNVMDEWQKSPARDTEGREKLWTMMKLIDLFEGNLKSHVQNGKFASDKMAKADSRMRQTLKQVV